MRLLQWATFICGCGWIRSIGLLGVDECPGQSFQTARSAGPYLGGRCGWSSGWRPRLRSRLRKFMPLRRMLLNLPTSGVQITCGNSDRYIVPVLTCPLLNSRVVMDLCIAMIAFMLQYSITSRLWHVNTSLSKSDKRVYGTITSVLFLKKHSSFKLALLA